MLLSPIRSVVRHGRTGGGGFRKQTNAKLSLPSDAGLTAPQPLAMQARNQEPVTLIRRHKGRHFKRFGKTRRTAGISGLFPKCWESPRMVGGLPQAAQRQRFELFRGLVQSPACESRPLLFCLTGVYWRAGRSAPSRGRRRQRRGLTSNVVRRTSSAMRKSRPFGSSRPPSPSIHIRQRLTCCSGRPTWRREPTR